MVEMELIEVWLPVLGYEGVYEASNLGRIRNRNHLILKAANVDGYPHVSLCRDGETQNASVHRTVLSAFCGPEPFAGAQAAHNNGVTSDCRLVNLRWATPTENQADRVRHGTSVRGSDVFGAVLDEDMVRDIKSRIAAGERNPSIARDYGVSISTIHLIRHGRTWRHVQCQTA